MTRSADITAGIMGCMLTACTTTATISRHRGPTIEGTIDRSDSRALYVTTPDGPRFAIERTDVIAIDHPGNAIALVGLAFVASGVAALAVGYLAADDESSGFVGIPRFGGWANLLLGAPMIAVGGAVYLRSRAASGRYDP